MVRNRCRKTTKGVDPDKLRQAAIEVKERNVSINLAAMALGIPRTTLQRYMKASIVLRRKTGKGKDWFENFRKRNGLAIRQPEATSLARQVASNRPVVSEFYSRLADVYSRCKFTPRDIYNMDESGFTTVQNPEKFVSSKEKKQVGGTVSQERGKLTTMACTVNAQGNALPPFYIFKKVRWNDAFLNGAPHGSTGTANKLAWMTVDIFSQGYLPFFIQQTKCSPEHPVLLILDNHCSHVSIEAVQLAKSSGVILLTIPPHTSHRLQLFDTTIFGLMKIYFNRSLDDFMRTYPGQSVPIYDIGRLTERSFAQGMTVANITSGFRCTGIYPLDANIFSDADYQPSDVTDRPVAEASEQNSLNDSQHSSMIPHLAKDEPQPSTSSGEVSLPVCTPQSASEVSMTYTPADLHPLPKAAPRTSKGKRRRAKTAILTDTPEK
ncbi:tigger transposable element-derived protein 1-like [Watersipora subatra]|uniref:tigger transposable element-derived protein 1-like n=1 Tax=Watersipora subatra TaxID=2589382 RepID=UPI00355BD1D2